MASGDPLWITAHENSAIAASAGMNIAPAISATRAHEWPPWPHRHPRGHVKRHHESNDLRSRVPHVGHLRAGSGQDHAIQRPHDHHPDDHGKHHLAEVPGEVTNGSNRRLSRQLLVRSHA
jgi:hypothetical protein